jgi:prepilin signal peptidase PulO-like enzyme (type II secretory pathway)
MEVLISFFVFLFGLTIGSFLNVLIYRIPIKLGFINGRSFCPNCKKSISWYDNIPLLSYFLLKGKCRKCKSPIPFRYLLVELLTGVLTVLIFNFKFQISNQGLIFNFKTTANLVLSLFLVWGLIVIFFIDLKHFIIPLEMIYPLIAVFFIFRIIDGNFLNYFLSGCGAFLFLFSLFLITKGKGMGFGDVQFAFLMGIVLGFPKIIVAFYLAFLTGAIIGTILIIKGKAKLKKPIPFGPFLSGAVFISYLWGEKILNTILAKFF